MTDDTVQQLSRLDDLEQWSRFLRHLPAERREAVRADALPLWLKRRALQGYLLFHPDVSAELKHRNWIPAPGHLKMIWANVLASLTGPDLWQAHDRIKGKILKRYGSEWWEDVNRRVKPTYAARQRLLRHVTEMGPGLRMMAQRSVVIGEAARMKQVRALEMIPRD